MEPALHWFQVDASYRESFQNQPHMFFILVWRAAVYEDVIEEGGAENVQKVSNSVVYEVLETAAGVREAEWYNLVLEMAISRPERGFPLLSFCDAEVVVSIVKI